MYILYYVYYALKRNTHTRTCNGVTGGTATPESWSSNSLGWDTARPPENTHTHTHTHTHSLALFTGRETPGRIRVSGCFVLITGVLDRTFVLAHFFVFNTRCTRYIYIYT